MTQKQIDNAIKNCRWLSQNRQFSLIPDICSGYCLPCVKVVESGKCDTLQELFNQENEFTAIVGKEIEDGNN